MSATTVDPKRPIKLTIAALGGQGGGVLASWLIDIAQTENYLVQSTSVPGVAQRTGATIYYLEFFPRTVAERVGRDPVMALMPGSADVDCVIASELAEAGRAIQRGLVDRERTTLIASSHRSYTISERSAMGAGAADERELMELVKSHAKRLIVFDMEALAEQHRSVISSVLLGALFGSGVLPFARASFEAAIEKSAIAVKTNLAAFEDACHRAEAGAAGTSGIETSGVETRGVDTSGVETGGVETGGVETGLAAPGAVGVPGVPAFGEVPTQARSAALQPVLDRVRRLSTALQPLVLEGVRRVIDYQDPLYAGLYLDRVERVAALDTDHTPDAAGALTEATARSLALWMTFEDTFRVADLKTRSGRFLRVREEVRAAPEQLVGITEFMKPRIEEIAGSLPATMGRWLLASPRLRRRLERRTNGKQVRTNTIGGFLLLHVLGGMRRWRRGTLRYEEENARIEHWLTRIADLAGRNYPLAVEFARAQRLVKGYGETHERGLRNFSLLAAELEVLIPRADGAQVLARLQDAALTDEEGTVLAKELSNLASGTVPDAA